ncbi:aldo/keto reductase [Sphingomonas sp. Root710]|uniref:aldo/keto reductase n=1 Tax=Sphingomonas sp. Root710 TaxID=1736594 RepID=UPI0006FFF956|nr:aldo/keto reductase [Sphingomonas sp. Root710]KRB83001.1 aldo/keto reductase [Sphingomonas sp. Root710]
MESRYVGQSGLRVSLVGLGCNNFGWKIDKEASRAVVQCALDQGITFFDTADRYGDPFGASEELLGEFLRDRRQDVILATKFGIPAHGAPRPDNSRSFILRAVEASLRRLQTDWIDLYYVHWPDPVTPLEETLRTLDDLVTSGKVRYIACSNMATWRMVEAHWVAKEIHSVSFLAAQSEYSLLARTVEADLLPALRNCAMGFIPYYPLASGLLTGKYGAGGTGGRLSENFLNLGNRFLTEQNLSLVQKLEAFAVERGHSLLELAMSWLASNPLVPSIIAGATRPEQVEQNAAAVSWKLSQEDLAVIDTLLKE